MAAFSTSELGQERTAAKDEFVKFAYDLLLNQVAPFFCLCPCVPILTQDHDSGAK